MKQKGYINSKIALERQKHKFPLKISQRKCHLAHFRNKIHEDEFE